MSERYPSDPQLLEAVVDFLKAELLPATADPALAYRLKVAINSLGIVRRGCESSADLKKLEHVKYAALTTVGNGDEAADLAREIRQGAFATDDRSLLAALNAVTMAKIAIDNPNFSTYKARLAED